MIEAIGAYLREIAAEHILPHYRALPEDEIREKSPGELVTTVDLKVEQLLEKALKGFVDIPVIGEERSSRYSSSVLQGIARESVWLVDPLDGTGNYIKGQGPFAVMVARIEQGTAVNSWIYLPLQDRLAMVEAGSGCWIDGQRITFSEDDILPPRDQIIAAAHTGHFSPAVKTYIEERLADYKDNQAAYCAGYDYIALALKQKHFSLYNRTLPWDHVPGTFLVTEAGGHVARFDGRPYKAGDDLQGLLTAATPSAWQDIRTFLVPPL